MRTASLLAAAVAAAFVSPAFAQVTSTTLPTSGTVVRGTATINQAPSGARLDIDQSSQRAIIDWTSFSEPFNIGAGGSLTLTSGGNVTTIAHPITLAGPTVTPTNANGVTLTNTAVPEAVEAVKPMPQSGTVSVTGAGTLAPMQHSIEGAGVLLPR